MSDSIEKKFTYKSSTSIEYGFCPCHGDFQKDRSDMLEIFVWRKYNKHEL
jgi:hypothetical protein